MHVALKLNEFITNKRIKVFTSIKIDTFEYIGDANIQLALMKKGFLDDQIVVSDSFPNKVGTYYFSLKTDQTFNNDQTYYLYMRNWCGFTPTENNWNKLWILKAYPSL